LKEVCVIRKLFTFALGAMLALTLLAGCVTNETAAEPPTSPPEAAASPSENSETPESETPARAASSSAAPTVDRAGNVIVPPPKLNRIIALAPSITQTLIQMGLGSKLAAVDTNSAALAGLPADLPLVDMLAPDAELLLTLEADLVLCSTMTGFDGSEPLKPLAQAGACVAAIPSSASIQGIKDDLVFIAGLVGLPGEGEAIVSDLETGIQEVKDATAGADRKTVYFEIAAAPAAYSFGSGTFMNEMIEIAGGENIFADMDGWLAVSEEQVIARNPDVIFTNVNYIDAPVGDILGRASLRNVTAVLDGQVFYVDNYSSTLSNAYILDAIHEMAAALHPDLWPND
jgi:iron complex transport system substrate-binding protein